MTILAGKIPPQVGLAGVVAIQIARLKQEIPTGWMNIAGKKVYVTPASVDKEISKLHSMLTNQQKNHIVLTPPLVREVQNDFVKLRQLGVEFVQSKAPASKSTSKDDFTELSQLTIEYPRPPLSPIAEAMARLKREIPTGSITVGDKLVQVSAVTVYNEISKIHSMLNRQKKDEQKIVTVKKEDLAELLQLAKAYERSMTPPIALVAETISLSPAPKASPTDTTSPTAPTPAKPQPSVTTPVGNFVTYMTGKLMQAADAARPVVRLVAGDVIMATTAVMAFTSTATKAVLGTIPSGPILAAGAVFATVLYGKGFTKRLA